MMKIAILGANYPLLSFYKQTRALGYEILSFAKGKDEPVCAQFADKFYPISFTDKEEIVEICKKEGVNGVTSFSLESALPSVYYISRELGIPCNSKECEEYTKNKQTMREQMNKENVRIPVYKAVSSFAELNDVILPLIVKPADNGGSRGVSLVKNEADLEEAVRSAIVWSKSKTVMVEQYIEGREFSVETISYRGTHYVVQITDKVTSQAPYFVELEHHQPAILTDIQKERIVELTLQTLNALRVEYGASHTEIKMEADDIPYVIEVGPRMGGGYIQSDLVRLSTGYDLVKGELEVTTGTFTPPVLENLNSRYAGVYFLCQETKEKVLPYIENKENYPCVFDAKIWGNIKSVKCNSDRAGCFIYSADKKIKL